MITRQLNFSGRVAVVTGGATGIGYETAHQLAELGAHVVIASRTASELEAAAATIREQGGGRERRSRFGRHEPRVSFSTEVEAREAR
ncbi:SDR family NAD(P)-dependent oxidoreductase [Phenylobacterium sp. LjRoot225]|uniref:SDR family NAD(P)-dependent oxidoreductase n=1 Tax=Phenylobacterium sp. LjRoot225 TaxID=3342285 RepID=UPI003ECEC771